MEKLSEIEEKEQLKSDSNKLKQFFLKEIDNTFNGLIEDYYKEFIKEHQLGTAEEHGAWQFYQFLKSK